jgi:hypothetical protein
VLHFHSLQSKVASFQISIAAIFQIARHPFRPREQFGSNLRVAEMRMRAPVQAKTEIKSKAYC